MGFIYKITNKINGKAYIGKTEYADPNDRWKQHINESKKDRSKDRPLYRAFNKYGIDNFIFEVLEQCDGDTSAREMYYIKHFNTYGNNGYNATIGGDGKAFLDYSKVIELYEQTHNLTLVGKETNMDAKSVKNYLIQQGVLLQPELRVVNNTQKKSVVMMSKEGKEIQTFDSITEAKKWLSTNGYKAGGASHITDVCIGKRKSACGFKWKFND